MRVVYERGIEGFARVYVSRFRDDDRYVVEFAESLTFSDDIRKKFVVILSTHFGCCVGCRFCDSALFYYGPLSKDEIISQLEYILMKRFGGTSVECEKFKVQFARMGEPALNDEVLDAIVEIKDRFNIRGYMPCVSTVAPANRDEFFDRLAEINRRYFRGWFQLQFSVHSTDESFRDYLIPIKKWRLTDIAEYGEIFYCGGRKITLNFALSPSPRVDSEVIARLFDPEVFAIKITPINPTNNSARNSLVSEYTEEEVEKLYFVRKLRELGYEVHVAIGPREENLVGSNCGQVVYDIYKSRNELS